MIAQRKPSFSKYTFLFAVLPAAFLVGVLSVLGCSSGDHSNAGSGPNLLKVIILEPAGDVFITEGDTVIFSATSTGGSTNTARGYTWQYVKKGDGPKVATGSATLTYVFAGDTSGEWTFTVTVTDADGYKNSASVKVTVVEPKT